MPPSQYDLTIRGWGVVRDRPWHLAGVFYTERQAADKAAQLGNDYRVAYGENRNGCDDFMSVPPHFDESTGIHP